MSRAGGFWWDRRGWVGWLVGLPGDVFEVDVVVMLCVVVRCVVLFGGFPTGGVGGLRWAAPTGGNTLLPPSIYAGRHVHYSRPSPPLCGSPQVAVSTSLPLPTTAPAD